VREIGEPIDVVFLDAWKDDYLPTIDMLLPKLRIGGCIIADNLTYPSSFHERCAAIRSMYARTPTCAAIYCPSAMRRDERQDRVTYGT